MMTKNGIQLDLQNSVYFYKYENLTFYFSSELYRKKFAETVDLYISSEKFKLKNKYRVDIDPSLYLAISLYKKIEKRGFFVRDEKDDRVLKEITSFMCIIKHEEI